MSAPPKPRLTAVEWAKENGTAFTWSCLMTNRDSEPAETGVGWHYWGWKGGNELVPSGGIVIKNAGRFTNAKESLYVVQERSGIFRVHYVAGWIAAENTMILHRVQRDSPIGPKRAYHLVVTSK